MKAELTVTGDKVRLFNQFIGLGTLVGDKTKVYCKSLNVEH